MINPAYSIFLFISGTVSLAIAGIAWKRRPSAGATSLAVTMLAMVIWAWMYAIFWLVPFRSDKLFWLSLAFVGVAISSPAFLVMAAQFSGKTNWPNRGVLILLAILPVSVLFSVWTEPWFGLFFGGVDFLNPENALKGGIGFSLSALNAYGTTFIAVYYLLRALKDARGSRREQIILILVGTSFPFVAGQISLLELSPFPGLDLTPIVFSLSGICYAYALFSYKMMDLAPMGRDSVIEEMDDGVLVVDHLDRIIDINPSAIAYLGTNGNVPSIGRSLGDVFPAWLDLANFKRVYQNEESRFEVEGENKAYFDISISPLVGKNGEVVGHTYILRDISKQKSTEEKLRGLNTQLEGQLEEIKLLHAQLREQAIRDSLTGLFNRGYLEETLEREMMRAEREGISLCVLMIDIDRFKQINDTYGHAAGDVVLRAFGKLLSENFRGNDVACRYGGDEFVVLMPNSTIDSAIQRGKQISRMFSEMKFQSENALIQTTISIGVAACPEHENSADRLLIAADKALYSAKGERNSISEYSAT